METLKHTSITVETTVKVPLEKAWEYWTMPEHITKWYQASDDWHAPYAENDLRLNGRFKTSMAAKDGSSGFDFEGVYTKVLLHQNIDYTLDDGRKVSISFSGNNILTKIVETFETENVNSVELQRSGWQAILDSFKNYAESAGNKETLHFEIHIKASPEKVYNSMLDKDKYTQWTAIFSPGSHFIGSWDKGSKILFIGPGQDGEPGGMVSRIKENIPGIFLSIEHLGILKNGEEIMEGKEVSEWAGALENYTFEEKNGGTRLSVDTDSNEEFKGYFEETWPKALVILKEICEA